MRQNKKNETKSFKKGLKVADKMIEFVVLTEQLKQRYFGQYRKRVL